MFHCPPDSEMLGEAKCRLEELSIFDLSTNRLYGTLPTQMGAVLRRLDALMLEDNHLSGTVPTQLGRLQTNTSQLRFLRLGANSLSGLLPTQLGLLTELNVLDLSANAHLGTLRCLNDVRSTAQPGSANPPSSGPPTRQMKLKAAPRLSQPRRISLMGQSWPAKRALFRTQARCAVPPTTAPVATASRRSALWPARAPSSSTNSTPKVTAEVLTSTSRWRAR